MFSMLVEGRHVCVWLCKNKDKKSVRVMEEYVCVFFLVSRR